MNPALLEIIVPHPDLRHVRYPLALAIDIGSSSVRAVVYDADTRQISGTEYRERYKLEITADGGSMCDPVRIRRLVAKCIRKACECLGDSVGEIAAVGISCHWHSLMGLNRDGMPITPVYMWSDKRSSADAEALATEINAAQGHQRTGCRLHSSYWPAKLRWLHRTRSDIAGDVATWCGLADWIARAPGTPVTSSISMASATGMLTTDKGAWDDELVHHLNIDPGSLPGIVDRTQQLSANEIHPDFRPPGLNARWYPAIGDGAAANIGASAVGDDRIALTIGTSGAIRLVRQISEAPRIPPSLFRYLVDADTEVIGGALSNGGNMMSWLAGITGLRDHKAAMDASARIPPDSHGLTVLPFFAGERAPSWQDSLGGTITGMSLDTSSAHVHRALLEATGLRFASVYEAVRLFANDRHDIVANGGALLQSPLWMQITADALGHDIRALPARMEASARGAAIAAMQAAGILPSLRTRIDARNRFSPDTTNTAIYRKARARQDSMERALTHWEQDHS